jgi:Putative zinc-finger
MIASDDPATHDEAWLMLPWLASGRLPSTERDKVETHIRTCGACREELAFQRLLCNALGEPDRVTYAPGPSFRKLMDRIDSGDAQPRKRAGSMLAADRSRRAAGSALQHSSLWRPPGLAWAASFVLMMGLAGVIATAHRTTQVYTTRSDPAAPSSVLHIAFHPTITIGEVQEVLRSSGAHLVEGPDSVGIYGVLPGLETSGRVTPERMSAELRVLSTRLRADPRVRWVEPIADKPDPGTRGQ